MPLIAATAIGRRPAAIRPASALVSGPPQAGWRRMRGPAVRAISLASRATGWPRLHRHRAHELEVVAVGVGGGGDPGFGRPVRLVRLADHGCAGSLEAFEVALHVAALEVPEQPSRLHVAALDLVMRPDGHEAGAHLPAAVPPLAPSRRAEELRVIAHQALRILGSDQDAPQVHAVSFLIRRLAGTPT